MILESARFIKSSKERKRWSFQCDPLFITNFSNNVYFYQNLFPSLRVNVANADEKATRVISVRWAHPAWTLHAQSVPTAYLYLDADGARTQWHFRDLARASPPPTLRTLNLPSVPATTTSERCPPALDSGPLTGFMGILGSPLYCIIFLPPQTVLRFLSSNPSPSYYAPTYVPSEPSNSYTSWNDQYDDETEDEDEEDDGPDEEEYESDTGYYGTTVNAGSSWGDSGSDNIWGKSTTYNTWDSYDRSTDQGNSDSPYSYGDTKYDSSW